jgi:hypothetical protein
VVSCRITRGALVAAKRLRVEAKGPASMAPSSCQELALICASLPNLWVIERLFVCLRYWGHCSGIKLWSIGVQ